MSRRTSKVSFGLITALVVATVGCRALLEERTPSGFCGDGRVQPEAGELCEPGQTSEGAPCADDCRRFMSCGDGVVDYSIGEECDEGPDNDDHGDCIETGKHQCHYAGCGDGLLNSRGSARRRERCDDGNADNGDGCSPDCTFFGRLSLLAGQPGGKGIADGVGSAARFAGIGSIQADDTFVYLSDRESCTLRRLRLATGAVTTIVGSPGECANVADGYGTSARLSRNPRPMALVGQYIYFAEGSQLRRVDLTDLRVDTCSELGWAPLYITALTADSNGGRIFVASPSEVGQVALPCDCAMAPVQNACHFENLAGSSMGGMLVDARAGAARFGYVQSLAYDSAVQRLYIGDGTMIRSLTPTTGEVSTVAGSAELGHVDAYGEQARFGLVVGLVARSDQQALFVLDKSLNVPDAANGSWNGERDANNHLRLGWSTIRKVTTTNFKVATVAGVSGADARSSEADGFGTAARFVDGISLSVTGGVSSGAPTLLVGEGAALRGVSPLSGQTATLAGALVGDTTFWNVGSLAAGGGSLVVPTAFQQLTQLPVANPLPRLNLPLCPSEGGAHFVDAVLLEDGQVYYFNPLGKGICHVDPTGTAGEPCCSACRESCELLTVPEAKEIGAASSLTASTDAFFLVSQQTDAVWRIDRLSGAATRVRTADVVLDPAGAAYDRGTLYVTSTSQNQVIAIDLASGALEYLATGLERTTDGPIGQASICRPAGIAIRRRDGHTTLFVGEAHCPEANGAFHGRAIRQIELDSNQVSTLLGPSPVPHVLLGSGRQSGVNWPAAIAYDEVTEALYVMDRWDNVILKVD